MRVFLVLILTYILGFLTSSLLYEINKRKTYPEEIFLAEKRRFTYCNKYKSFKIRILSQM